MQVVLLAAGRSRRMKPIGDKNFLKFIGKPLIEHQLEILQRAGLRDILIVGGAHNVERLGEFGFEVIEQKDLDTGMCGAVLAARGKVGNGPILIFSSNDVVDEEAFKLIVAAAKGEAESYLLGKKVEKYFPGGYLETDSDGMISNIVEKPGDGKEPSNMINLVVHVHKNPERLMEYLEKVSSDADDMYEVALAAMMKDGVKMQAVPYTGFWQPIKFPWHVFGVFKYLFAKADKNVHVSTQISENAVVNGEVIIAEGVKIFDGAVVNGPCYIGRGSVIATNALVRESNIGEDCVVGFGSEVARSFLGDEVWTHTNYIGDSVIGNNVSFGAGSVTGNLRLDEAEIPGTGSHKFGAVIGDDVRVGINTSLMPGVKIGEGSFVGAGIVVAQDIPEKSFVRGEWELKISENKTDVKKLKRNAQTLDNNS